MDEPSAPRTPGIDTDTPGVARMYDYYLGGKDNFEVDRQACAQLDAAAPSTGALAVNNRRFLQRAVRHLATDLHCIPDSDDLSDDPALRTSMTDFMLAATGDNWGRVRTVEEVTPWFDGLELLEPGLVEAYQWRPDPDDAPQPSVWPASPADPAGTGDGLSCRAGDHRAEAGPDRDPEGH